MSDLVNKTIDKIFDMRKETFLLILIFLLAFILRFIAAINASVSADDMHHVIHALNFLSSDRLILWDQSSGLWHAFTSVIYEVLGTTQLASRFASIIFGSLSVLLVFSLTKEFFNEKISLIAAFLLAVSPFQILNTMAEMDIMAMFFVLISLVSFIKATKSEKLSLFATSGVAMGLAIYTKVYPLLFIPSILLFFVYTRHKSKQKIVNFRNIKFILIFLFAIFIFTIPALTHNYLLYKDKGFLDLQFTRALGLGEEISKDYYGWTADFHTRNSWKGLFFGDERHVADGSPLLLAAIGFGRLRDPIGFYLGLLGIILILSRKESKEYLVFFLLSILFVLPFLASIILLPKHYLFLEILMMPMAALSIESFSSKINRNKNSKKLIILVILSLSIIFLGAPAIKHVYQPNLYSFYGKSQIAQIIDFKMDSISEESLMVSDSRIYRGRVHWTSLGRPYLEGVQFIELLNQQDDIPGKVLSQKVYYIECVLDDCGWGTIKYQPEFNASMETLTDFFIQNGKLEKVITEPSDSKVFYPLISSNNKREVIRIYSLDIPIKEQIIQFAKQPKEWFLYSVGFSPKEKQFDYYETNNALDSFLDMLAHWIVKLAVILAFISPIFVIYLIVRK